MWACFKFLGIFILAINFLSDILYISLVVIFLYFFISIWNPKKVGEFYKTEINFFNPKSIFYGYKKRLNFWFVCWIILTCSLFIWRIKSSIKSSIVFYKVKHTKALNEEEKATLLPFIEVTKAEMLAAQNAIEAIIAQNKIPEGQEDNKLYQCAYRNKYIYQKATNAFQRVKILNMIVQDFKVNDIGNLKNSIFFTFIFKQLLLFVIFYISQPRWYSKDLNKKYLSFEEWKKEQDLVKDKKQN